MLFMALDKGINWDLTHCGLVAPYGDIDLGHHWFRRCLVVWRHQTIILNNVNSTRYCGTHVIPISLKVLKRSIRSNKKISSKNKLIKLFPHLSVVHSTTNYQSACALKIHLFSGSPLNTILWLQRHHTAGCRPSNLSQALHCICIMSIV